MKQLKNTPETSEFTEETALAFFARYLDEQKWSYNRLADSSTLLSGFNGADALWDFNLIARQKSAGLFLLGVNSFIPNKVRPERRAACAELLTRINFELTLGSFAMNCDAGELCFRTSVLLPGADITSGIVEHLVGFHLATVDECLKSVLAVLYSDTTPAQALQAPEARTEPTAEPRIDLN